VFDPDRLLTDRIRAIDASGIRRVFDLAAELKNPVNLSIGQPDFEVPGPVRAAAQEAIEAGCNRYTVTQGQPELREAILGRLSAELGDWDWGGDAGLLVTSGVSGGLMLALMCCAGPGDEVIVPDPYFVMYPHLATMAGARPVRVDTYPDFQLTAERVEAALTDRTKMVLLGSPANPTGAVASEAEVRALAELCRDRGVLLLSDEIYDAFCYEKAERAGAMRSPSPAAYSPHVLVLRGFSKTYGMTGWRLGCAAGPAPIIDAMTKLQQYSFVCAPSMVQWAGIAALEVDMAAQVERYRRKRDRVVERLGSRYALEVPGGAFYAFPEVPAHLGLSGSAFVEQAIGRGLLIIPGAVFSDRDTHFRLSYACDEATLEKGLDILVEMSERGDGRRG